MNYSPNQSVGLVFAELSLVHPIVPFIDIPGTFTLGITPCRIGSAGMISQGRLAVLRCMAHIRSMGVAVVLYFPPGWSVALWWVVAVDRIADVP